jgi:hypothetical protein
VDVCAGWISGAVAIVMLQPLDTILTRWQAAAPAGATFVLASGCTTTNHNCIGTTFQSNSTFILHSCTTTSTTCCLVCFDIDWHRYHHHNCNSDSKTSLESTDAPARGDSWLAVTVAGCGAHARRGAVAKWLAHGWLWLRNAMYGTTNEPYRLLETPLSPNPIGGHFCRRLHRRYETRVNTALSLSPIVPKRVLPQIHIPLTASALLHTHT